MNWIVNKTLIDFQIVNNNLKTNKNVNEYVDDNYDYDNNNDNRK